MASALPSHLLHEDNIKAIDLFTVIIQSVYGPNGRCKMLQNNCGGHVLVTSASSRLINNIVISNPIIKLITSAANNHLKCYKNDGLYLMLLFLELSRKMLKLQLPQKIISDVCFKLKESMLLHLQGCSLKIKLDFENLKEVMALLYPIINSKPACCLSQKQRDHIAYLLMRGFLNTIPKSDSDTSKIGNLHFVSQCGLSPDHCQILDGILVETRDSKLIEIRPGIIKCALFHVSLSGDLEGGLTEENLVLQGVTVVETCKTVIMVMAICLVKEGVEFVGCQKVIHPCVKKYLSDHGILVLDRLGLLLFNAIIELTGGCPIEKFLTPFDQSCLGYLESISSITLNKKNYYFLQNSKNAISSLLLYNYHEESLEELKHVCHQGIEALRNLLQYPYVFCGGGCLEMHLAAYARYWGKENVGELMKTGGTIGQVTSITEAFAKSVESVARALSKQGMDMLVSNGNHHLWLPSGHFSNLKESLTDFVYQCSCGAITKNEISPDLISFTIKDHSNPTVISKWSESPISESQKKSMSIADGALSKLSAFKMALETFVTIMHIDTIIQKA